MGLRIERNRIVGAAGTDYYTCLAADLGSALGRTIGSGNVVVTGRDGKGFSRLMKRALTCGVMENGIQVLDTRLVPGPVMRYCIVESSSDYGVYLGFHWRDQTQLAASFFDARGALLDESMVKRIMDNRDEAADRTVPAREVGDIMFYAEARTNYVSDVLKSIDTYAISRARPKVLIDCSNGAVSVTLPQVLRELQCSVILSHDNPSAYMAHKPIMSDDSLMADFALEVREEGARLGIALDPCGESVRFVDDEGEMIPQGKLGLLLATALNSKKILLQKRLTPKASAFTDLGVEALPLERSHEMMMPRDVDIALGEDDTCYLRDGERRWWDAVPVSLKVIELLSKGPRISEALGSL